MQLRNCFYFLLCVLFVFVVGCSKKPKNFPKVSPCTITVMNEGNPLSDASVELFPKSKMSGVICSGTTDTAGVCQVATVYANHREKGVPEGEYTVVIVKEQVVEDTKTPEEQKNMTRSQADAYRKEMKAKRDALPKLVPPVLTSKRTSPIKMTVQNATEFSVKLEDYSN